MNRLVQSFLPNRQLGITLRTALLGWLVAIGTLVIFVAAILPRQKQLFIDNLGSKAYGATVSLGEIAAGAVVNEDYSSVVDHCMEMLKRDPAVDYIVITRNDGFSLVHDRTAWDSKQLAGSWRPPQRVATGGIETVPLFNRRVFAYSRPFDYSGIEWGWIHIGLTLDTYDQAIASLYKRTALVGATCLVVSLVVSLLNAGRLVRPLLRLKDDVERVAAGHLEVRAPIARRDEIGQLAESFNTMTEALQQRDRTLKEANDSLEARVQERTEELRQQVAARERTNRELADAQRRLMQLSREAGMAEVATGVLHNVGNVLNSANVSVSLLREAVRNSELPQLARTVGLLETRRDTLAEFLRDDTRGRLVLPFLGQLSTQLDAEHRRLAEEIGTLQRSIEHIKEIVAMQQTFARTAAVLEEVSAAELLRHCLEIHQGSLDRHQVRFELEIAPDVPALTTDRHNVLQILNNFVSNAIHATKAKLPGQRLIVVRAERLDADRVALSVRDNGAGIPPENLPRIFRLGFTTRKDGHGFGLHSGVLAARSLGGALDVFSAGAGQGATFTLTLPVRLAEPAFKTT